MRRALGSRDGVAGPTRGGTPAGRRTARAVPRCGSHALRRTAPREPRPMRFGQLVQLLGYHAKWTSRFAARDVHAVFEQTMPDLRAHGFGELPRKRVLDLGCGPMYPFALQCAAHGARVTALDVRYVEPRPLAAAFWHALSHDGLQTSAKLVSRRILICADLLPRPGSRGEAAAPRSPARDRVRDRRSIGRRVCSGVRRLRPRGRECRAGARRGRALDGQGGPTLDQAGSVLLRRRPARGRGRPGGPSRSRGRRARAARHASPASRAPGAGRRSGSGRRAHCW